MSFALVSDSQAENLSWLSAGIMHDIRAAMAHVTHNTLLMTALIEERAQKVMDKNGHICTMTGGSAFTSDGY